MLFFFHYNITFRSEWDTGDHAYFLFIFLSKVQIIFLSFQTLLEFSNSNSCCKWQHSKRGLWGFQFLLWKQLKWLLSFKNIPCFFLNTSHCLTSEHSYFLVRVKHPLSFCFDLLFSIKTNADNLISPCRSWCGLSIQGRPFQNQL